MMWMLMVPFFARLWMGSFERTVSVRMIFNGASSWNCSSICAGVACVVSSIEGTETTTLKLLLSDTLIVYTKSMRLESPIYQHFPGFSYGQIVHLVRSSRAPMPAGCYQKPPGFRINNIENTGLAGFLGSVSSNRAEYPQIVRRWGASLPCFSLYEYVSSRRRPQ